MRQIEEAVNQLYQRYIDVESSLSESEIAQAKEMISNINLCLEMSPQSIRHREVLLPDAVKKLERFVSAHE